MFMSIIVAGVWLAQLQNNYKDTEKVADNYDCHNTIMILLIYYPTPVTPHIESASFQRLIHACPGYEMHTRLHKAVCADRT